MPKEVNELLTKDWFFKQESRYEEVKYDIESTKIYFENQITKNIERIEKLEKKFDKCLLFDLFWTYHIKQCEFNENLEQVLKDFIKLCADRFSQLDLPTHIEQHIIKQMLERLSSGAKEEKEEPKQDLKMDNREIKEIVKKNLLEEQREEIVEDLKEFYTLANHKQESIIAYNKYNNKYLELKVKYSDLQSRRETEEQEK